MKVSQCSGFEEALIAVHLSNATIHSVMPLKTQKVLLTFCQMKKLIPCLAFLVAGFVLQAQQEFANVDGIALRTSKNAYPNPESLAKALCKDLKSERDKARVIFSWITANMRYDMNKSGADELEADTQEEYNEKRVKLAYRKGRGVCMDYALLYQKMATAVGLECVFITGFSKGSLRGGMGNHAWNAVKIAGKWELLDATWGAGTVVNGQQFRQVFQPGYFFTEPKLFALDHLPEEAKWQFLDKPLDKTTFKEQPNFSYGDPVHDIQDTRPFGQALSRGSDGKIELRLQFQEAPTVIELKMGGRSLKFDRFDKENWVILRFIPANSRELQVWGGEKNKKGIFTTLLGVFPVK